jgi:hypothetical protein
MSLSLSLRMSRLLKQIALVEVLRLFSIFTLSCIEEKEFELLKSKRIEHVEDIASDSRPMKERV